MSRFLDTGEHLHDARGVYAVEVSGGLIGQQDGRIVCQGAGNRHALALTRRELVRILMHPMFKAHLAKQGFGPLLAVVAIPAVRQHRHLHVLDGAQSWQQIESLKDESHLARAVDIQVDGGTELGVLVEHFAAGWRV